MAWWIAIQPRWRVADDSSFIYETPAGEEWHILHKGGSAGLYTVVVALSWWIKALPPAESSTRAWTAVHDVQWVIDQISENIEIASTTSPAPQGKKRGCEESEESGRGKRFVLALCMLILDVINIIMLEVVPSELVSTCIVRYMIQSLSVICCDCDSCWSCLQLTRLTAGHLVMLSVASVF